jgi:transcriptional regulator GlxA family with amidase domain
MNAAILLFDDVEVLDFAGPFEVFNAASFDIVTVGTTYGEIRTRGGLRIRPTQTIADPLAPPTVLIVPGGFGTRIEMRNGTVLSWLRATAARSEIVFSICTGSLLLAAAGALRNLAATTHHDALGELRSAEPCCQVTDDRIVDNGAIVTAAGVSSGIDGAFHVLARLAGQETAIKTARYIEYPWSGTGA